MAMQERAWPRRTWVHRSAPSGMMQGSKADEQDQRPQVTPDPAVKVWRFSTVFSYDIDASRQVYQIGHGRMEEDDGHPSVQSSLRVCQSIRHSGTA
nr:hypothetical protein CFP56_37102 [Quercus suber]